MESETYATSETESDQKPNQIQHYIHAKGVNSDLGFHRVKFNSGAVLKRTMVRKSLLIISTSIVALNIVPAIYVTEKKKKRRKKKDVK